MDWIMKKWVLFFVMFSLVMSSYGQSYDKLWKQVEQAREKSLPQTVIELTGEIYRKGLEERNTAQMLKATECRDAYREYLTPDSLYANLAALEQWAQEEDNAVTQAVLYSLLAGRYAGYAAGNRYQLAVRTEVDEETPSPDIREWSAGQFVRKVDACLRASLQGTDLTAAVTDDYVPFVEQEDGSRFYGHDMYHLLGRRAVENYRILLGLGSDSLLCARVNETYQRMADVYAGMPGREDARLLVLLDYWQWKLDGGGVEALPEDARAGERAECLQRLDEMIARHGEREVCVEVYIRKAELLSDGEVARYAEALRVCEEGIGRYGSDKRVNKLKNLRATLLQPSLRLQADGRAYPGDTIELLATYRNLEAFALNIYRTDFREMPWEAVDLEAKDFYKRHARKLSSQTFDLGAWSEENVYQSSDTTFRIKVPEAPGVYVLQVCPEAKGAAADACLLAVSRLRTLTLPLPDNRVEVTVVDGLSGHPVQGAKVSFYTGYNRKNRTLYTEVLTDAKGTAVVAWDSKVRTYTAGKGDDTFLPAQRIYHNGLRRTADEEAKEHLTLLTDRSIYRPGQRVYVKGVAYKALKADARVLEGKGYTLRLLDANRKELSVQEVRTNEFGSFAATFALPSSCLNGSFTLEVPGEASTSIRVEEYKRPSFSIVFNPVEEAYRLGDTLMLTGKVESFNGVPVQEVPLTYTVKRGELWQLRSALGEMLKADTVALDASGAFAIPVALEKAEGDYASFNISVTVTDGAGETQSADYALRASRWPYRFVAEVDKKLCKDDSLSAVFTIRNENNSTLTGTGAYRLYPIKDFNVKGVDGTPAAEGTFVSGQRVALSDWKQLPSGCYRLVLSALDGGGEEMTRPGTNQTDVYLFSRQDTRLEGYDEPFLYEYRAEFEPGRPAVVYFGTTCKDAYVFVDIFGKEGRIENRTLALDDSLVRLEYPYQEKYGEGISVVFTFVKNNAVYSERAVLEKKQPERTLDLKWEVFRDRLRPGQEEEWRLVVKTPQGLPAAAELLATMYDASLDQLYPNRQSLGFYVDNYLPYFSRNVDYAGREMLMCYAPVEWREVPAYDFDRFYAPSLPVGFTIRGYGRVMAKSLTGAVNGVAMAAPAAEAEEAGEVFNMVAQDAAVLSEEAVVSVGQSAAEIALRTNFAETAFFYPQLRTNEQGEVVISFTLPESLTTWTFRAWAHTRDMMTGQLEASAVSSKEFMLTPNMPRFLRTGDRTQIAAKVTNRTQETVKGKAVLTLFDPTTEKILLTRKQAFSVTPGGTGTVDFAFEVDDRYDLLGVRIVADGGRFSDGEQHLVPVLSNKEYLTETLPLPVRGKETRTFSLDSLFNRHNPTATGRRLTVEFTGNPAWYAVQALPSLSQQETDNAVAWAVAWYANSLAGYIVDSNPRIRAVFDSWQAAGASPETFLSQLEQNQEVKNILLTESPWLLEATTESEQRARIAVLFDVNQQRNRIFSALSRLKDLQGEDGAWSWYKGMPGSRYITTHIATLLVRLPLLTGEPLDADAADMKQKALGYLADEAMEEYRRCLQAERRGTPVTALSGAAMDWLYLLALEDAQPAASAKAAYDYFFPKVKNELATSSMGVKAQAAVILLKGNRKEAGDFIASLREHLVQEDELGAHFAFNDTPYRWGMMPVPTHVAAMEALRLAGGNDALLEEMKLWLLKQKQATSWTSPVVTADAVYALLCQGEDLTRHRGDVRITLGSETLETQGAEAVPGLSYVKKTYAESPVTDAKVITVEKRDEGIAWGAVYAQYLSPIADVKQHGGPLSVEKKLYVERLAPDGKKTLQPVAEAGKVKVGDKVVSRITLRTDRAMDFVQLKDSRAACLEPVGSLSGYRLGNGIGYYMEIKDAVTNFFFDGLGKGTYVLESSYRVARAGTYETGLATLQCAYAPEFSSHSAGGTLTVE